MELLLDAGAEAQPHEVQAYLSAEDEVGVPLGSLVELIVRRSSMLIMLGTGFLPPAFLRSALRRTSTARAPRDGDPGVPDMARSLALVMGRGGARPTEKSQEEGSDLARAAYFLDADIVETLVRFQVEDALPLSAAAGRGMGRALVAAMIGVAQMKHRLNRALLQQPRMAGRLFRNYYGFDVPSEEALTHPDFVAMSFEDTVRIVQGKAMRVVRSLLAGGADPSYQQSRQSRKAALHHCAEHGLTELAETLLAAGADPNAASLPSQRTPLHIAVVHRSLGVLKALTASGADMVQRDLNGRTPSEFARLLRWVEGQRLLGVGSPDLAPPLGQPMGLVAAELLPPGWRRRWERGDLGSDWQVRPDCELDVVQASELTAARFMSDFLSMRRPLLVQGGARHMLAFERWHNLRYVVRKAGDTTMSAVTIPYPEDFGDPDAKDARRLTLREYVKDIMGQVNSSSGTPLYIFSVVESEDPEFKKLRMLVERDASPHPHWLSQDPATKLKLRFGNVQFGLGPTGSGAPQHYHTHAYASLFSGRKRWWFYPPPKSALSRHHAVRAADAHDVARRGLKAAPIGKEAIAQGSMPLLCEQLPGDLMYVPTDWGHMTLNEGDAISLSREFTWDGEETDVHVINSLQL